MSTKREGEIQPMNVRLPLELHMKVKHYAVDARKSVNEIIIASLLEFLTEKQYLEKIQFWQEQAAYWRKAHEDLVGKMKVGIDRLTKIAKEEKNEPIPVWCDEEKTDSNEREKNGSNLQGRGRSRVL